MWHSLNEHSLTVLGHLILILEDALDFMIPPVVFFIGLYGFPLLPPPPLPRYGGGSRKKMYSLEEDDRLDYKETMDITSEKHWLELTKDVSAFANTYGGYLVFGVDDGEKKVVGLSRTIAEATKDVNNLHQKLNRHLEPHIISLRVKEFKINGLSIVILYIPQSVGVTHMISKDGIEPPRFFRRPG
jgi:hypothetical protein